MVTLEQIRVETAPDLYPREVLEGCESALVLFSAAFLGKQDAIHIADAGIKARCVDTDQERLKEMVSTYPADWSFVVGDAFKFARLLVTRGDAYDVVSLDPPTNLFDRCAADLPLWCALARRAVILGCGTDTQIVPPAGWAATGRLYRSSFQGGVYWAVLEPVA